MELMNFPPTAPECLKSSLVNAMFKKLKIILCAILLLTVMLLSSCIDRLYGFDTDYPTGELLTPEMIDSIIDAATVEEVEKYPTETDPNGELIVYWLPGGSVWHASANCPSVSNADNVSCGSITNAISQGKKRPCKICAEDVEYTEVTEDITQEIEDQTENISSEKYPKDYMEDGTLLVYWTKSGTVWHESLSCPSLANTVKNNIFYGTSEDAIVAGKERACKKCS